MNIVKEYPPNYAEICAAIPGAKEKGDTVIFTYGDIVYSPSTLSLPDHLHNHEAVHVNQQKQMGRDEWWTKYLADTEFRLKQELQAYRVQYNTVKRKHVWQHTEELLRSIAKDLSGDMYGNIITYEEARRMITK